jgi:hypothetical protein
MSSVFSMDSKDYKFELYEDDDSALDKLVKDKWLDLMAKGHFNYELSKVESRHVGKFLAQLNPMRATTRRKPQAMLSVRQDFDDQRFNFTKGISLFLVRPPRAPRSPRVHPGPMAPGPPPKKKL